MVRTSICLVIPPITDFYFTRFRLSALGVRKVATTLRGAGFNVTLIDATNPIAKTKTVPLPSELSYLRPFIDPGERGRLSYFRRYSRLGPSPDEMAQQIADVAPDTVLIGCFAFAYADDTRAVATAVRLLLPDVPIVVGGAGPSVHPDYFLEDGTIDTVVVGAIDDAIGPLALELQKTRAEMSRTVGNPSAPREASFYASVHRNFLTTMLTTGCKKRCRFCSIHLTQGSIFSLISPSQFARGIRSLDVTNLDVVNFEDDSLLADLPYFEEIVNLLRQYHPDIEIRAENGLDPDQLSDEAIDLLGRSGMQHLNISIGSANAASLNRERRTLAVDQLPRIVGQARERGMDTTLFWICGLEEDSRESVLDTLAFIYRLGASSGISLFYAVPGLAGFPRSRFTRDSALLCKGSSAYPWNGSLSTKEMVTAFRLSRLVTAATKPDELVERCFAERRLFTQRKSRGITRLDPAVYDESLATDFFGRLY